MRLVVDPGTTVSATFNTADSTVHLTQAALDALGADEAAVAFLIAREQILGFAALTGTISDLGLPSDPETAAEVWSLMGIVKAGYNPGGMVDCMNRVWVSGLQGIPVDTALQQAFGSVTNRLSNIDAFLAQACGTGSPLATDCQAVHALWQPNLVTVPL
jgi:hypothetical protein